MALPVANLGYMPNLGTPGHAGTTVLPQDPWKELAMQVLGQTVSKGLTNEFSPDYTKQAQNEGLAIDPSAQAPGVLQRFFAGPTTSQDQLDKLRGEQGATNRAALSEKGATKRSDLELASRAEEGRLNRGSAATLQQSAQNFQTGENAASRTNQMALAGQEQGAAKDRLQTELAAQEDMLGRKLTSEETQHVIASFIDQAGKMTAAASSPAMQIMSSMKDPKTGQPIMPTPDANAQIDALAKKLQSMGYKIVPSGR